MKTRLLKELVKKILTRVNVHQKGDEPDILILSSPRSGSTWLMEIIYTQPGIKYIDEPLGKNILDYHNFLPIETRWNYISLDDFEKQILKDYFQKDDKIKHFSPRNIFGNDFNFFTNRRVLKVIRANSLIKWFERELEFQIIYLIRHPIAQSISCINRGHHCQIPEYLENEFFAKTYLDSDILDFARKKYRRGTEFEKFVTEWCLDNLVPLRALSSNGDFLTLTYEELVLKPRQTIDLLYEELDLSIKDRMYSKITIPSKTTDSSTEKTKDKIESHDPSYLLRKWESSVSEQQKPKLFAILKRFGLDAYTLGRYLPHKKLLNFPEEEWETVLE